MINKSKTSNRLQTRRETQSRRSSMVIKVLSFNIQKNKLSQNKKYYLKSLFLEAKLKHNYNNENNQTIINGKTHYKYQKLSRSLRTTKTCVCGNVNKDITLKDRVYVCSQCGYENDRDTHSSYMINHTLNHIKFKKIKLNNIEYQQEEALGCGIQSKDLDNGKNLILDSNLGQTITSAKTEQAFNILSSKLKSNNLFIKFNDYSMDKSSQEASLT